MNKYVIETKQLTKTYGEQTVVNSVNIHVKQGQIYGLLFCLWLICTYTLYPVQQQLSCEIFPVLFWHRKSIFRLHFFVSVYGLLFLSYLRTFP